MSEPQHQEQNHDSRELVEFALDWIEVGYKVSLATVVSTWGSSPRPAGSQLLIREDNLFEGENTIPDDISFEFCVFGNTASYTVYAKETGSTCVITVTKYGTPQRTGC